MGSQHCATVGADTEKTCVAKADLASIADQQIKSDRHQCIESDAYGQVQVKRVAGQLWDSHENGGQQQQADAYQL